MPLLALAVLLARPIGDVDIFWQVRLGDIMIDTGRLVTREPFAATHPGVPLVPLSALAQVVLAAARRIGGWPLVRGIDAVAWTGGFLAAGLAARARGAGPMQVALALVLCLLMALPFSGVRPQSFAVLGFGLLMLLLRQAWPLRLVAPAGAALLVVWQNLHPSVSLAIAWLGARAAIGWGLRLTARRETAPWAETVLLPLAGLALLATPAGLAVFGVSALNARMSQAMGVSEWLPLFDPQNQPFVPALLTLNLFALGVLWLRRREVDRADLGAALVFLVFGLAAGRFLLFWALTLVPVLAGGGAAPLRNGGRAVGLFLAGALIAGAASALRAGPWLAPDLPIAGVEALARGGYSGTIYASYPFGGLVADSLYPRARVAFDGRYYRYSAAEWTLCRDVMAGRVAPEALEQRYRPAAWLLSPDLDRPLIAALRQRPGEWREVRGEPAGVLFVPAGPGRIRSRP